VTLTYLERRLAVALVVGHALVSGVHGLAHAGIPVTLAAWQQGFVVLVPTLAPLAALALLYRGYERLGVGVLTLSMAAAFLFGVSFRYLLSNPDNVASIPTGSWHLPFTWTAAAIALTEFGGAALGAWLWIRDGVRDPAATPA
jgi:hypothetical protein